jgi:hypothetical protein
MKYRILTAALLCVFSMFAAAPAQASCTLTICGTVYVPADPPGAGRGVIITCDWNNPNGSDHVVPPGGSSKQFCKDADGIYVATGREVRCLANELGWVNTFDATGWHKVNDSFNRLCYDKAD